MKIFIRKRAENQGGLPARDMMDHIPGQSQPIGFSIPVDYSIEGELLNEPIEVGKIVNVLRTKRNGVEELGKFTTSPVVSFTDNTIRTKNSIYDYFIERA